MAKTRAAQLVYALQQMGAVEVQSKTRKYRTFHYTINGELKQYYVGKAGALRMGTTVAGSISLSPDRLIAAHPMPEVRR